MSIFEYDEELLKKQLKEEGIEEGIEQGIERGERRFLTLLEMLTADNRMSDLQKVITDKDYRQSLYAEYEIE